jgi:hypothetical protein
MPNVKITELVELLDRQIAELRAGDPSWDKTQKKKAKDAIEMMKAFRLLSEQQCTDALQSIPGPPTEASGGGGSKSYKAGKGKKNKK